MKSTLFALAVVLVSQSAFAGMSDGVVTCQSSSGRTKVNAIYPVDGLEASIKLTVDGKSSSFSGDIDAQGGAVSMVARRTTSELELGAYDASGKFDLRLAVLESKGEIKKSRLPYGGELLKFKATVKGQDPRSSTGAALPEGITVTCVYDYHF